MKTNQSERSFILNYNHSLNNFPEDEPPEDELVERNPKPNLIFALWCFDEFFFRLTGRQTFSTIYTHDWVAIHLSQPESRKWKNLRHKNCRWRIIVESQSIWTICDRKLSWNFVTLIFFFFFVNTVILDIIANSLHWHF